MQPNLQQDEKFNYAQKQQVMSRYLALSDRSSGPQSTGVRDATHLIWPESAFPFFLTREGRCARPDRDLLPQGTVLITGAVRPPPETAPNAPVTRAYNSIYVIGHDGSILSVYDKVHLCPVRRIPAVSGHCSSSSAGAAHQAARRFIAGDPPAQKSSASGAPDFLRWVCYESFSGDAVPPAMNPPRRLGELHQPELARASPETAGIRRTGQGAPCRRPTGSSHRGRSHRWNCRRA